jgi:hypothetical protein
VIVLRVEEKEGAHRNVRMTHSLERTTMETKAALLPFSALVQRSAFHASAEPDLGVG